MNFLILPCNKYAKEGDYMKSKAWRKAREFFPEYKFAAVDSIITIYDPQNDRHELGSLVLYPEEMYRVKGYDAKPLWEKFRRNNFRLLREHAKYTEIGLQRIVDHAEKIIVVLNVRAYRLAMYLAIIHVFGEVPNNIIFLDLPDRPWAIFSGLKLAKTLKDERGGVYRLPWKYHKYSEDVPQEFKYWKKEKIIEIKDI